MKRQLKGRSRIAAAVVLTVAAVVPTARCEKPGKLQDPAAEIPAAPIENTLDRVVEQAPVAPGVLKHHTHRFQDALARDFHRPSWHLGSLSGDWGDVNGLTYHNGRYHGMFMRNRYAADGKRLPGNWGHASTRDLLHWRFHPDSVTQGMIFEETEYPIFSGDSIENAPQPTLIFHVPRRGTQIAVANDDDLLEWKLTPQEPVLKAGDERFPEVSVFDPTGWYDAGEKTYYALIGHRSQRKGYEGDSTSLFRSPDLKQWEYLGPLYKSSREFTSIHEDTACADFFPLGKKWVLMCHVHNPWTHCRWYVGEFDGRTYAPETMGRLTYLNDQMAAPETVLDDRERRVFFGQVRTNSKVGLWRTNYSLPVVLTLGDDNTLRFDPAEELQTLRYGSALCKNIALDSGTRALPAATGRSIELRATFTGIDAEAVGFRLAASSDGEEFTDVVYRPAESVIEIDFARSDLLQRTNYRRYHPRVVPKIIAAENNPPATVQHIPLELPKDEPLDLHVFFDGCIIEVIANRRTFAAQTIYPSRRNSVYTHLIVAGGTATASHIETHYLDATMAY